MWRYQASHLRGLDTLVQRLRPTRRVLNSADELLLFRYCFILALFEHVARNKGLHGHHSPFQTLKPGATVDDLP
jgi:hypothetical protein